MVRVQISEPSIIRTIRAAAEPCGAIEAGSVVAGAGIALL